LEELTGGKHLEGFLTHTKKGLRFTEKANANVMYGIDEEEENPSE
jgi:hypothetical protein